MRSISIKVFALLIISQVAWGQVPGTISYQGLLKDVPGDSLVDGNKDMTFRLLDVNDGNAVKWEEQRLATSSHEVLVTKGLFNVSLGEIEPLTGLDFSKTYALEVGIWSDGWVYLPAVPLQTVPYAFKAAKADSAINATVAGTATQVIGSGNIFPSEGNVGIGISPPQHALDVAGTVNATSFVGDGSQLTGLTASPWTTNGDSLYYNNGNVGIGTMSPTTTLHLNTPNLDGILLTDAATGNYSASLRNFETYGGQLNLVNAADTTTRARIRGYAVDGIQAFFTAGNVGIGTANPQNALDVVGTVSAVDVNASGTVYTADVSASGNAGINGTVQAASFVGDGSALTGLKIDTAELIDGAVTGSKLAANAVTTSSITDDAVTSIKIGAGEIDGSHIDANSTITAASFVGNGSLLTGLTPSPWDTSGPNIYYNNGNVGIGTTDPSSILTLNSSSGPAIRYEAGGVGKWSTGIVTGDDRFTFYALGAAGYVMQLDYTNGNVGIGTT
ncbi:MAG: hypothetical protein KAU50_11710, partial [Candidatus Marinimicrobia bacterium]|nr:hypothetical protein [Candidatus Neomarinimicrobiota bacterium]